VRVLRISYTLSSGLFIGFPRQRRAKAASSVDQLPPFDETNLVRLFRFVQCDMGMVSMHLPHGSEGACAIRSYIHFDANKLMIN
jgi:hypothetical protein